jgi:hypothetical protein
MQLSKLNNEHNWSTVFSCGQDLKGQATFDSMKETGQLRVHNTYHTYTQNTTTAHQPHEMENT